MYPTKVGLLSMFYGSRNVSALSQFSRLLPPLLGQFDDYINKVTWIRLDRIDSTTLAGTRSLQTGTAEVRSTGAVPVCKAALLGEARSLSLSPIAHADTLRDPSHAEASTA